jgi:O-antigen/teichoic acid export membrane protein
MTRQAKFISAPLIASCLRATTLGLRFGLMFFLARKLSLPEMGLFGLYWAGLQLATSLIALDVYAHSSRLLLKPEAKKYQIMAVHLGFLRIAIIFLAPVSTLLFYISSSSINGFLALFFLLHLPLEVISTDIGRLLVPLEKPLMADKILFVRSALWVIPLVAVLEFTNINLGLFQILGFWIFGSILAVALALGGLRSTLGQNVVSQVDATWIRAALLGGGAFLLATILFRGILGVDRFLIEHFLGVGVVGIYSLYASVCLGVLGLIESSVSAWHYPRLIKFIQAGNAELTRDALRSFVKKNSLTAASLIFFVVAAFSIVSKKYLGAIYYENISAFYIIAAGVLIYCLSMPFHYVVYGFRRDSFLVVNYMLGFLVLVFWAIFFMGPLGVKGAAIMLALALISIGVGRYLQASLLLKKLK